MKTKIILLSFLIYGVFFTLPTKLFGQTIYDTWKRSQSTWHLQYGLSAGLSSGLDINFTRPRRNTCKVLNKMFGFDFGIYYEGLLFEKSIQKAHSLWSAGGFRGNALLIFYPDLRIEANRAFIGGGMESGTRKWIGNQTINTDLVAKLGWELSFTPINGWPLVLRISAKANYSLTEDFFIVSPTIGFLFGK